MNPDSLPEGIIARFRTLSLERIGRVEAIWNALVQGVQDENAIREMSRDLHTLKGDARIVGFDDIGMLAHKLEELVALAGQIQYQVSEDFELVVTMATQFLSILLRKKATSSSGIDLPGFVRQVDEVLRETRVLRKSRQTSPRMAAATPAPETSTDRLSEDTRHRLAIAATTAFIEYLGARGATSRTRVRSIWQILKHELSRMHATALAPLLDRHVHSARELATELNKKIELDLDLAGVQADTRVAEAVDIALLHLVRNAVDHGIELPAIRAGAGKNELGRIRVRAREVGGTIEIAVSDDGRGIDLEAVRARGIEGGFLELGRATTASSKEILELVFKPGFSTRSEITDVSGRGVGMDAVKAGVVRVGGSVEISSEPGAGSTVTLVVPAPLRQIRAYQFLAPGGTIMMAVSARWTPTIEQPGADALDPIGAIQLMGSSRHTQTVGTVSKAIQDLALRLRWGFLEIVLRAATEPVLVTGDRICPTPDDYPIEVISVDGHETLLLRPEYVANLVERPAAASH